jgi:2-polyprenyl-6-methoxyphenol hydroxylase-like FAD-dependent oxidoreductase
MACTLLARAGWEVAAYEQAGSVREIGAGLFITHNGLLVLEEVGILDALQRRGVQLTGGRYVDGQGGLLAERNYQGSERTWLFPRPALIEELQAAALAAGAEIRTGTKVVAVTPGGRLECADGAVTEADLIVAADGFHSAARRSLGLEATARSLGTTSIRFLIPDRSLTPETVTTQYWSGRRRLALTPCSPTETYVYLACPEGDVAGSGPRFRADLWTESFPVLAREFEVLAEYEPHIAPYVAVHSKTWHAGRVAMLGDAAHAMAPTLGQGTNLSMVNARSLVTFLGEPGRGVEEAIERWERAVRPLTESAQWWSSVYDTITKRWPPTLARLREPVIRLLITRSGIDRRMRAASETPPVTESTITAGAALR